jgi:uncharacterized protein YuzE
MMIHLADGPSVESEKVAEYIVLAFDKDNRVVAIEFVGGVQELFPEPISQSPALAGSKTVSSPAKRSTR